MILKQLFETHLDVRSLERSMVFYEDMLGLELGYLDEERRIAFYWVGGPMRTMLGLWEKGEVEIPKRHIAFEVALEEMVDAIASLQERGVVTNDFAGNVTATPFVFAWMPAAAIYFDDPDGHLLELIATVPGTAEAARGIVPLPEWLSEIPGGGGA